LKPSFNVDTVNYTVKVSNEVTNIDVTGTATHPAATVSNVTNKPLITGNNDITITVTAEDGTTQAYTVTVIRSDHVYTDEADLVNITINGREVDINDLEYIADCEDSHLLELQSSQYATIEVNDVTYTEPVNLTVEMTNINIKVISETEENENIYTVKVFVPINEDKLYFKRWNDVIAINRNPATNGGYHNISEIRWYKNGSIVSNKNYIQIETESDNYYAEIRINDEWHRVCGEPIKLDKIIAYPNPIPRNESLKLQLPDVFVGGTLNIYDIPGTLQRSGVPLSATNIDVNISNLSSGIHLLHFISKKGHSQIIKIIVE
jgi:hypothetical protein